MTEFYLDVYPCPGSLASIPYTVCVVYFVSGFLNMTGIFCLRASISYGPWPLLVSWQVCLAPLLLAI